MSGNAAKPLIWWGLLGLALILILIRPLGDLDFGFYVASGRHFLATGLPSTEFLAPLLTESPLSSQWILSAILFATAWEALGPAGITILCSICYGSGIALAAFAAWRRTDSIAASALSAALVAALVAPRFVERPGCFSVLILGGLLALFASQIGTRQRWMALVAVYTAWPWLHAEWILGLGITGLLLAERSPREVLLAPLLLIPPVLGFWLIHPTGPRVLLGPLLFLFGGGPDFGVKEYQSTVFALHPPMSLMYAVGASCGVVALRARRFGEAAALLGLTALTLAIPRAVLPLGVIAIPGFAAGIQGVIGLTAWKQLTASLIVLAMAWIGGNARPGGGSFGFGLYDRLDSRGIGLALEAIPDREGVILSEFGSGSMLLIHPSVTRQGVVMDGRQEAYSIAYFDEVYQRALQPVRQYSQPVSGAEWYRQAGITFYFEPWEGLWPDQTPNGLYDHFRGLGWSTIAWDNSGILMAAPEVIANHQLDVLDPPPNLALTARDLDDTTKLEALLAITQKRTTMLASQGIAVPRPLLAVARYQVTLGQWSEARETLRQARTQGGAKYASYRNIDELIRAFGE